MKISRQVAISEVQEAERKARASHLLRDEKRAKGLHRQFFEGLMLRMKIRRKRAQKENGNG